MPSNMPDARTVNEALRRAREMQNRSRTPPEPLHEPEHTHVESKSEPGYAPPASPPSIPQKKTSPLDLLLKDKDRTLILALLILLSSEGDNTELLFALMYLLI